MVDIYHVFKIGTSAAKLLKAGSNISVLINNIWKPMAMMGIYGITDAACEDLIDITIKNLVEEKE